MANLKLKKPSKRQLAGRRYKIEKRIRDHNRKKRKEAKKNFGKAPKKLIHVPNLCPFKEDILKTVDEYKQRKEEERLRAREAAKAEKAAKKASTLEELVDEVKEKNIGVEEPPIIDGQVIIKKNNESKQKSFYREFQKVIAAADVILEVVDARDPLGTRCPQVEEVVRDSGELKRLVLVLNKADLVTRENLDKWLKYLRRFVPTIPFKSSTQSQGNRLGRRKMKKGQQVTPGAICMGAEGLTSLLANYTRNKGIKTVIRVGVVGLPNVGKSSLINSLKRSRACKVGAIPGVTRNLQEVQLDSKIKLLDSPGLALASSSDPHAVLKNSVLTTDAIEASEMILARASPQELAKMYLVPDFKDSTSFLASLAKRFGKYGKGGVPDLQAAGQVLLQDWNRGKISYHTEPPEDADAHISSSIVISQGIKEFDLETYDKENMEYPEELDTMDTSDAVSVAGTESSYVVTGGKLKASAAKKKASGNVQRTKGDSLLEAEGNLRMKKLNKLNQKKLRKQKKKNARREDSITDGLTGITI